DFAPSFIKTRDAIDEIAQTVRIILSRRPGGLEEEGAEEAASTEDSDVLLASEAPADTDTESISSATADEGSAAVSEIPQGEPGDLGDVARQLASICSFLRTRD